MGASPPATNPRSLSTSRLAYGDWHLATIEA
jgi:hypothetical protein